MGRAACLGVVLKEKFLFSVGTEHWFCGHSACKLVRVVTDRFIDFVQLKVYESNRITLLNYESPFVVDRWMMVHCAAAARRHGGMVSAMGSTQARLIFQSAIQTPTMLTGCTITASLSLPPQISWWVCLWISSLFFSAKLTHRIWGLRAQFKRILGLLCSGIWQHVPYFPAHKMHRDFFVRNFRKKWWMYFDFSNLLEENWIVTYQN